MTQRDSNNLVRDPQGGSPVELAEFATYRWWSGTEGRDLQTHPLEQEADGSVHAVRDPQNGEWHVGLEWPDPRDICQVEVSFAGDVPPDLRVQYWRQNWPTPAPERWSGARRGWIGRDDPWHGQWTTVRAEKVVGDVSCTFTFDPIDVAELGGRGVAEQLNGIEHYLARFRRTLKLRLVSGGEAQPVIANMQVFAPTTWREGEVDVQFEADPNIPTDWRKQTQITNGHLLDLKSLDNGVRLRLLFSPGNPASADGTVVTVRTPAHSFSFLVADLESGPIYIRDYGVFITWADAGINLAAFQTRLASNTRSIYDRVADEPEQSLSRATAEIPPLDVTKQEPFGRYVILGVEAGRQEFALRYNGELFADKRMLKLFGRDSARLLWPGHQLRFRFGSGDPPDFRERRDGTRQEALDGWLPIFSSQWLDREIEYQQTAFATLLEGPMTEPAERRGDEDIVALLRFNIRNTTHGQKRARLWIVIAPQEQVEVRDGLVVALGRVVPAEPVTRQWRVDAYETAYLRCAIDTGGRGALTAVPYAAEAGVSQAIPTAIAFDIDLAGGETHTLTLAAPFVTLTEAPDWQKVAGLDFEARLNEVTAYWQQYIEAGAQLDLPDAIFNDFHKAVRAHVGLNVDKDPASGLIIVPAGTWAYGACGNEACWQISMLDQAGHHDRARTYLQIFLDTQGALGLDGNFTTSVGVLQGMDLDDGQPARGGFSYNTDHGYIMECLADHYRYTGDQAWLKQVAPQLVAACDFVSREREATQIEDGAGHRVAEWGLLPAGHLEDNPEWRYWFAVNAHAYSGMKAIAEVLAEIDHPDAARLAEAAAAYRADIRAAARRAMTEAPVVQLLDGTYIPHVPTRTGLRGREWGWFREAAYGAIQLLEGNVFDPNEQEMTWIFQDLEDNLYVSREWGRPVDLEKYWFSHGGVTIQPSLTDFAIDYLRRGQVKHALRSLFNHFGASVYPDVRVFTEHPVVELGHGVGPFYKTPDETKWLTWLRTCLLREEGDALHLALGVPRAWFACGQSFGVQEMASFFGPVSFQVEVTSSAVTIRVDVPDRRPPSELSVHVRLPAEQVMKSVTVNGQPHMDFDPVKEAVRVAEPSGDLIIQVDLAQE